MAGQAVTHDTKGNTTSIPAVLRPGTAPLAMRWDFENKLIGADIDNDATDDVTYQWDALLHRVGRDNGTTATVFVQNGQQTVADYTSGTAASSPTHTYVYASYGSPLADATGKNMPPAGLWFDTIPAQVQIGVNPDVLTAQANACRRIATIKERNFKIWARILPART